MTTQGNNLVAAREAPSGPSLAPSVIQRYATWDPASERLPATAEQARRDAAIIEAACAPARPAEIAVELAKVLVNFDLPSGTPVEVARLRARSLENALAGTPLDVVRSALARVEAECKWFPKPADLRERVDAELGERKRAAIKAGLAASMAERRAAQPSGKTSLSPEQQDIVDQAMSRLSGSVRRFA